MCCSTWTRRARVTICGKLPWRCGGLGRGGGPCQWSQLGYTSLYQSISHSTLILRYLEMSFGGGPPLFGFKANCSPNKVFQSCQILNFTLSVHMVRPGRISWRRSLCQRNTGWSLSGPRAAGLQASWPPCFSCHVCHCAFDAFDAFVSGVARGNSCIWVECITSSCFIRIWCLSPLSILRDALFLSSCSFKRSGLETSHGYLACNHGFLILTKVPGLPMSTLALT